MEVCLGSLEVVKVGGGMGDGRARWTPDRRDERAFCKIFYYETLRRAGGLHSSDELL